MDFVDVFVAKLPTHNEDPSEVDGITACVEVLDAKGKPFFHLLLSREQYNHFVSKNKNFAKKIRDEDGDRIKHLVKNGSLDICPRHVFGSSMKDPETGEEFFSDTRPNEIKLEPAPIGPGIEVSR